MENKKLTIIILSLLISLTFFIYKKSLTSNEIEHINPNRFLLTKEKTDKICSQVSDSFKQKYNIMNFTEKEDSQIKKNTNDEDFINLLKEQSIYNFSNYIKYLIYRYFFFIIFDFILIFFWICYCSCCCNPCCCCKGGKGCCSKISYSFSLLMFIGLIATGILGFVYGNPLKKNIIEASCSAFKLFTHFENGLNEDYGQSKEWIGLNNIYNLLGDTEKIYNLIKDNKIINKIYEDECKKKYDYTEPCMTLGEGNNIINNIKDNHEEDISNIYNSFNSINKFKKELNDIENKYIKDAYNYLDDYVLKYSRLYTILFALILVFGLLGLLLIVAYVHTCKCIKCCYAVLWNLESLFMIIIVLIGVCFGLIGCLSQNLISAIEYSITFENLNNTNPIIFNEKLLEICFNGDGILDEIGNINSTINENFKNLLKLEENIEINYSKLTDNHPLKEGFESLRNIINETSNLFNNYELKEEDSITDMINCRFMKSDIDIFIVEVRDNLKKTLSKMEIIIYIASLCAGLSIMFGIIVINRYVDKNVKKKKRDEDKNTEIGEKFETERNKIKEK